jgi:hypothetical protein
MSRKPKTITLEDWAITFVPDPYKAPEQGSVRLVGFVDNHPNFENGEEIVTSPVTFLDIDLKMAQSRNTTFNLGAPAESFLEFLKKEGHTLDQYNMGTFNAYKNKL